MVLYTAVMPILSEDVSVPESFARREDGFYSYYERDERGKAVLKFSTEPEVYLRETTLP